MKKVVFSVTKQGRYENTKTTGVGYITDTDLITACVSKNGKPYIRVFEDCVKNCHAISGRDNEYRGAHYEIREIEFEKKTSRGDSTGYETREVEINYSIWYKITD